MRFLSGAVNNKVKSQSRKCSACYLLTYYRFWCFTNEIIKMISNLTFFFVDIESEIKHYIMLQQLSLLHTPGVFWADKPCSVDKSLWIFRLGSRDSLPSLVVGRHPSSSSSIF